MSVRDIETSRRGQRQSLETQKVVLKKSIHLLAEKTLKEQFGVAQLKS